VKVNRVRAALIATAVVGAGAAVALALPAGASVSLQSQSPPVAAVALANTATFGAKGAVVTVSVKVTCQPGGFSFLNVQVTQKSGSGIAVGRGGQDITCTGSVQELNIPITANGKPFKKGVAFGQANLTVCGYECEAFQDAHDIQIVG
jgi:hypothetical protein